MNFSCGFFYSEWDSVGSDSNFCWLQLKQRIARREKKKSQSSHPLNQIVTSFYDDTLKSINWKCTYFRLWKKHKWNFVLEFLFFFFSSYSKWWSLYYINSKLMESFFNRMYRRRANQERKISFCDTLLNRRPTALFHCWGASHRKCFVCVCVCDAISAADIFRSNANASDRVIDSI